MKVAKIKDVLFAINRVKQHCDGYFDAPYWYERICDDLRYEIEELKTFNYKRRKHGQWQHLEHNKYRCTACERASYVETVVGFPSYEYCPNCGAKMDKKSPENHKKYQEEETNKKAFK